MPNAKDPKINSIVLTGKVASAPESRQFGESTVTKIVLEAQQLKKTKGQWERQKWTIDVKGWNKTAEKLQALSEGALVAVTGKLEADIFEYQGQMRQKLFLSAFQIEGLEAKEQSRPRPAEVQEELPEEPVSEDDIPF